MKSSRSFRLFKKFAKFRAGHRVRYFYQLRPLGAILIVCFASLPLALQLKPTPHTVGEPDKVRKNQSVASAIPTSPQPFPLAGRHITGSGDSLEDVKLAWQSDIITTVFWVGETADKSNSYISNAASAWDEAWQSHYGGVDSPTQRNGFLPAGFTPTENPFYFALPYNDIDGHGNRKADASICTGSSGQSPKHYSWCKNTWIIIKHGNINVYAQWQDVGPYEEDDSAYVSGLAAAPRNKQGAKAGLDVSPAIRDYLHLQDVDKCSWSFISANDVPNGPWKQIVTTSYGDPIN